MNHMQPNGKIPVSVNNVNVTSYRYPELLENIKTAIDSGTKLKIAYANANTINLTYSISGLKDTLNSFDIVHTDGIGIYFAERYLRKGKHPSFRFTGSDFYPVLAEESIK